jgi:uncharacterized membrane protein
VNYSQPGYFSTIMSSTEQQSKGESRQREQGSSQRQQRRADSDHRRRQDEDQDKQEKKSKQEEEKKEKKPDFMKKFAGALPLILGLGFCVAFFVWVCLQMAGQTVGGPPLLLGIFGGAIIGIAAAGAAMGFSRLADKD